MLNCGNLRLQCKGKGTSAKREADSTDVQPRGGATRSSVEVAVMAMERRYPLGERPPAMASGSPAAAIGAGYGKRGYEFDRET